MIVDTGLINEDFTRPHPHLICIFLVGYIEDILNSDFTEIFVQLDLS